MWVNFGSQGPIPFAGMELLPSQMAALASLRPEQRLLLALLEAAWESLSKYGGMRSKRAKRLVEQEFEWVHSDDLSPFSFRFCCEYLDLDPEVLRGGIYRALEQIRLGKNVAGLKYMAKRDQG